MGKARSQLARSDLELIGTLVESIPMVGTLWADVFRLAFGVADAMNLQHADYPRDRTPHLPY
jgi:hypothetical protein